MTTRMPGSLASDVRSLDSLKSGAARDPKGAVRQAASQFEALFMQMVMKSMRDAVPKSGLMESGGGGEVFQGMLDTQFSQAMTGRPGGLGDMIAKQLMRNMAPDPASGGKHVPQVSTEGLSRALLAADARKGSGFDVASGAEFPSGAQAAAAAAAAARSRAGALPWRREAASGMPMLGAQEAKAAQPAGAGGTPAAFVNRMWGAAASAEQATGVPASFIVGQAALETGWGRHELRHPDGRTSHNLFGIKAGSNWKGATVDCMTTEYVDGRMVKTVERFRAYGSYQEAFGDWAKLMANNPRYSNVLASGGSIDTFARNMQRAGYATDPNYGSKLASIITQAVSLRRVST
jgi:peptidoglycan hydrolase FlgJ